MADLLTCIQLHANQHIDNYRIRALPNNPMLQGFDGGINSAILRYRGAPNREPKTVQKPSVLPMNETDLHPLDNAPAVRYLRAYRYFDVLISVVSSPGCPRSEESTIQSTLFWALYVDSSHPSADKAHRIAHLFVERDKREVPDQRSNVPTSDGTRPAADHQRNQKPPRAVTTRKCYRTATKQDRGGQLPSDQRDDRVFRPAPVSSPRGECSCIWSCTMNVRLTYQSP